MKKQVQKRSLGQYDIIEVYDVGANPQSPVVVLFHGYGADAGDLAPLHSSLECDIPVRWIFPEGPLQVSLGGGYSGRAWFPVDIAALERAVMTGESRNLASHRPPELTTLRESVIESLSLLGVPLSRVVFGGFSQGSMLATEIALSLSERPGGLVILSGTLIDEVGWRARASERQGLRFFQSHGRSDNILSFVEAQKLEKLLTSAGLKGQLLPFSGGHEIPIQVTQALKNYLASVLKQRAQSP